MTAILLGRSRLILAALLIFGSLPVAGCQQGVRRIPVSGTVTLTTGISPATGTLADAATRNDRMMMDFIVGIVH